MPGVDDYEYDPLVLGWNPHDLDLRDIPKALAALSYRWADHVEKIWLSSNARDDTTSVFHPSNKAALTILAKQSGCYLETDTDQRSIVVCRGGHFDEKVTWVKQMLSNLEQHLVNALAVRSMAQLTRHRS
jgi:hypothetical protein